MLYLIFVMLIYKRNVRLFLNYQIFRIKDKALAWGGRL